MVVEDVCGSSLPTSSAARLSLTVLRPFSIAWKLSPVALRHSKIASRHSEIALRWLWSAWPTEPGSSAAAMASAFYQRGKKEGSRCREQHRFVRGVTLEDEQGLHLPPE